jgi:ligand-binding SRPBCC domain-containing protein
LRPKQAFVRCKGVIHTLQREQTVFGDPAAVWDFFATPRNLDALTPPSLRFEILGDPPARMYAGQMIAYRIGILPGIATRWLTEITHVREGGCFVDEQRIGPYRLWHHEHHFAPAPGGVVMTDRITYDPGFGPVGVLLHAVWIRRQLEEIFDFRARRIAELFPRPAAGAQPAVFRPAR